MFSWCRAIGSAHVPYLCSDSSIPPEEQQDKHPPDHPFFTIGPPMFVLFRHSYSVIESLRDFAEIRWHFPDTNSNEMSHPTANVSSSFYTGCSKQGWADLKASILLLCDKMRKWVCIQWVVNIFEYLYLHEQFVLINNGTALINNGIIKIMKMMTFHRNFVDL